MEMIIGVVMLSISMSIGQQLFWLNSHGYAATDSDDAATFPTFGLFLERLGETKPNILLSYIDRFAKPLANFLPGILNGLVRSEKQVETLRHINHWIDNGEHLNDIAWYLRFSVPFDEAMLRRVFNKTIAKSRNASNSRQRDCKRILQRSRRRCESLKRSN